MAQTQIAHVISRYIRGGAQMAMVVIHRGEGSNRRSETRHIALSTVNDGERVRRTWVGNNPDPTTVSRREQAARLVSNASANHELIAGEIAEFEKLVKRELTADELEIFRLQGFSTPEKIKEVVEKIVIPALKTQLASAKVAADTTKAFQAEINEAYPLTVEFVGL
ncbi:MAG: hypothetical protein A3B86_01090 [Candidatus Yanofskybacteria bacterium RIFCSPHIGHO2_02_FULL_38_22b]|uniref:Uncharacterized protein n=1 Tax=Candidatus Yanofskybacteria bacterium RIFCSPHIGHO2_02_FULL_38_22b TaxID=1802673 RepID=A0A1F8F2H9_9BACT|nr:MAG: hypothetical protein A3B86_01090 [Candidatus Yanofskybacteria bacterium RIFCSPHIGHO2_02_FULL_38_22b]OGN20388.1 MAG: hypothetical protein A2910_01440 [Candidatus Yanofskybacteria bacterium RIFCSPLOWO2_01_FULL_39_28]